MRKNIEHVSEVNILSLSVNAEEAIKRLQQKFGDREASFSNEQIQALINSELENLPDVEVDAGMLSFFYSSLWSI